MSLFKFNSIQALVNAKNNPRVRATAEIKNGYILTVEEKHVGTGTKSLADITVGGTPAAGTLKISVGGYRADVTTTATTAAATATVIYNTLLTILTPYGYILDNTTSAHVKITAPTNSSDTSSIAVVVIDAGVSGVTFSTATTAGTLTASYDEATKTITTLTATDRYYIAMNIIDTPELWKQSDFAISEGGYVNTFELNQLIGYPVEISSDLVTTAFVSVDADGTDFLVPDTSNAYKWVKADSKGNAAVAIKVLEKTTFGGTGFYGKLV